MSNLVPMHRGLAVSALALGVVGCAVDAESADAETEHEQSLGLSLDSLICEGKNTVSYDPPLTNTPQQVRVTSDAVYGSLSPELGLCIAVGAPITGGVRHTVFDQVQFCNNLLGPAIATHNYTWNTGATSSVLWTVSQLTKPANQTVVERLGIVTAGFGVGHQATSTMILPELDLDACTTTGLAHQDGVATLAILPL